MSRPPLPINKNYILERIKVSPSGCWLWDKGLHISGYGRTTLRGKQYLTHRLAYCIWTGMSTKSELFVLHKCHIKKCCNPSHLYAGTQADNIKDAVEACAAKGMVFGAWNKGKQAGLANHNARLSLKDISEIRLAFKNGATVLELEKRFKVGKTPLYQLKNKTHWSDKSETQ